MAAGSSVSGKVIAAAYQMSDGTVSANLAGPGALIVNDDGTNGTVTLSGTNTYAGGTVVQRGTLIANSVKALPSGSRLNVEAGGALILDTTATSGSPVVVATSDSVSSGSPVMSVAAATAGPAAAAATMASSASTASSQPAVSAGAWSVRIRPPGRRVWSP